MLGAIGARLRAARARTWAIAAVFVALVGSFLISYTRARPRSLGIDGKAGLMGRAERVVLLGAVPARRSLGRAALRDRAARRAVDRVTVVQRVVLASHRAARAAPRARRAADLDRTAKETEWPRTASGTGVACTTDATCTTARCASRSSASAIARRRWCRASTTTGMPTPDEFVPGLMHVDLGGYHVCDIEVVAAFDVDADKVGHDLSEAIWARPNNTERFADVPPAGVTVAARPDARRPRPVPERGRSRRPRTRPPTSRHPARDEGRRARLVPARRLRGRHQVVRRAGTRAGVGFVNCMPVFIAPEQSWAAASTSAACRSSATTSRARSAPPSCIAC